MRSLGLGLSLTGSHAAASPYGPELSPNVTLDDATGISVFGSATVSGGVGNSGLNSVSSDAIRWTIATEIGAQYHVTWTCVATGDDSPNIYVGDSGGYNTVAIVALVDETLTFTATETSHPIWFGTSASCTVQAQVDNMSVRKVL